MLLGQDKRQFSLDKLPGWLPAPGRFERALQSPELPASNCALPGNSAFQPSRSSRRILGSGIFNAKSPRRQGAKSFFRLGVFATCDFALKALASVVPFCWLKLRQPAKSRNFPLTASDFNHYDWLSDEESSKGRAMRNRGWPRRRRLSITPPLHHSMTPFSTTPPLHHSSLIQSTDSLLRLPAHFPSSVAFSEGGCAFLWQIISSACP